MTRPLSAAVATRLTAVAIVSAIAVVIRRRIAKAHAANFELAARAAARAVHPTPSLGSTSSTAGNALAVQP